MTVSPGAIPAALRSMEAEIPPGSMAETSFAPASPEDVSSVLRFATENRLKVQVWGGGSHQGYGRPERPDLVLLTNRLDAVEAWEPDDLTLVLGSGAPVAQFEEMLGKRNQTAVMPENPGLATIGGVVSAGVSSLKRARLLGTRERLLEVTLVTGDGRIVRAGGRVVKNVSGYDLSRFVVGAFGALGVVVSVCLKLWPVPRAKATVTNSDPERLHLLSRPLAVLESDGVTTVFLWGIDQEVEVNARQIGGELSSGHLWPNDPDGDFKWSLRVPPALVVDAITELPDRWRYLAIRGAGEIRLGSDDARDAVGLREWVEANAGRLVVVDSPPGSLSDFDPWGAPPQGLDIQRRLIGVFGPAGALPGPASRWHLMGWVTAEHPTTEELNACVQCGLCLPHCPTFRLTGRETASPRGRLHAMSAVHEGVVEVDAAFQGIIDFCLGCRACEPVCPGLVPYGRTLEGTRAEIVSQRPSMSHRLRAFLLGSVLGSRRSLKFGTGALSVGQRLGATRVAPRRWRRLAAGMRGLQSRPGSVVGHNGGEGRSGRVALLAGCIQDNWFQPVNHVAVELLEMAGYRVEVPGGQTCCGALAAHDGKAPEAHRLAERNTAVLSGYDMVVATAAGCSAHLRDYDHWAAGGEGVGSTAEDVTVSVARAIQHGLLPRAALSLGPIGVQDPCHLRHAQKVTTEPRLILEAAGYEVVEIDPTGMCCGAAGLYTILQPQASQELGNRKASQVRSTGVKKVASANPGCEMQLRSALGDGFEIAHPIEWYFQAIKRENPGGIVAVLEESR